jgi:hypothetical protein
VCSVGDFDQAAVRQFFGHACRGLCAEDLAVLPANHECWARHAS